MRRWEGLWGETAMLGNPDEDVVHLVLNAFDFQLPLHFHTENFRGAKKCEYICKVERCLVGRWQWLRLDTFRLASEIEA